MLASPEQRRFQHFSDRLLRLGLSHSIAIAAKKVLIKSTHACLGRPEMVFAVRVLLELPARGKRRIDDFKQLLRVKYRFPLVINDSKVLIRDLEYEVLFER